MQHGAFVGLSVSDGKHSFILVQSAMQLNKKMRYESFIINDYFFSRADSSSRLCKSI